MCHLLATFPPPPSLPHSSLSLLVLKSQKKRNERGSIGKRVHTCVCITYSACIYTRRHSHEQDRNYYSWTNTRILLSYKDFSKAIFLCLQSMTGHKHGLSNLFIRLKNVITLRWKQTLQLSFPNCYGGRVPHVHVLGSDCDLKCVRYFEEQKSMIIE